MSEIAARLFESVLFVVFLIIFLEPKRAGKILYFGATVCVGLLFGTFFISDRFSIFSALTIVTDLAITMFFWKMCLKGTLLKFFIAFALYYFGICYRTYIVFYIFAQIDLSLLSGMMYSLVHLYLTAPQAGVHINGMMTGLLFLLILTFFLSCHALQKQEKESEIANLSKLMAIQRESIERFIRQERELHKAKHDLEHRMYFIRYLVEQNRIEEASAFFKQVIEEVCKTSQNMTVAENIADTVISNIELKYASSSVVIQKDISYFGDNFMEPADLCILLGNLADNAVEAASMSDQKRVIFCIEEQKKCLHIKFSNSFSENHSDIRRFSTGKEMAWKHGFGMRSIREIVDKYHGDIWMDVEQDFLHINIVISG